MEMNQELLWDYESIAIFTRVNRKYDRYSKGLSLVLKQKIDALYDDVEKPIHKLNKLLPETMQVLETHDNSSESFNLLATYFLEFYRNHQSFDKEEFARLVINEMVNFDAMDLEEDIFLLIHKSTLSLGLKWYLLWILEQPQAAYDELELITKTITPIIQKHSLHFTKEIETISTQWNQLAQSDSLETFLKDNLGLITIPSTKDFYFSIVANDRIVLSSRKSIIGLQFTMDHFTSRELSQDEVNRGLKLLGDSSKYAILKELGNGEKYGRELAKSLDLSAATISYHIQELLNEGFVSVRTSDQNNRIYYQIRKSKIKNLIDFAITDLEL